MSQPTDPTPDRNPRPGDASEPPWRFAGDQLGRGEFISAMVHFYRGEVTRSNTWRTRLDATTNWAVVTTGAALTFAFGGINNPPVVLLIVTLLVVLFLFIEARRYRYYELWTHRVRLMETNFFSALLAPPYRPRRDWADRITDSLQHPSFPITLLEAVGRRYRRNYALLFVILAASWLVKVWIHPVPAATLREFLARAALGAIPGWVMLVIGVLFNGGLVALGLLTVGLRQSDAEVFGRAPRRYLRLVARLRAATREALEVDLSSFKPTWRDGRKQLVFIISDESRPIADALLKALDRGVTYLKGVGMYSGEEHGVLLCVLQGRRQVDQLKQIVHGIDDDAFVVITGAQEVRGEGFRPLEA